MVMQWLKGEYNMMKWYIYQFLLGQVPFLMDWFQIDIISIKKQMVQTWAFNYIHVFI